MFALSLVLIAGFGGSEPMVNVQSITTDVTYVSGRVETQKGLGFVVGQQFVTVNHNIAPRNPNEAVTAQTIYIGSIAVSPVYTNAAHDIAVFDIPAELCEQWCEKPHSVSDGRTLDLTVNWPNPGNESWSVATTTDLIVKGTVTGQFGSCANNVVIEVDAPFFPGSSGGPVVADESGEALGVVQGSFSYGDGRTAGYYKPLKCVFELMDHHPSQQPRLAQLN